MRRGKRWLTGRKNRRRRDGHRPRLIIKVVSFPIDLSCGVRRNANSYITVRVRPAVGVAWPRSGSLRVGRPERLNPTHGQFRTDGLEIPLAACLARFGQRHAVALPFIWKADGKTSKMKLEQRS